MHNMKKVFFALLTVFALVLLAGCSGNDPVALIVENNPIGDNYSQLVFDADETVNVRGELGFSYWRVTENGVISEYVTSSEDTTLYDDYTDETLASGGIIRTYTYGANAEDAYLSPEYKIYILPETPAAVADEIVLVVFRYTEDSNIVYNIGQSFDPTGIEVYAVQADGTVIALHETLSESAFAALFTTSYVPLSDGEFAEQEPLTATFTYEGYETTITNYVGTGEKPITVEAANWFDYILIIPVAFVMQLFAGIFGNSFAIGIIITTIIVRTIAWPIYAKSNDMTMRMNLAQPELQKIQTKYATRKDPQSQQMMQMETMQIYKKHKIGAAGCLMPFLQMPIFIAMYRVVLRITLEGGMYTDKVAHTRFLGIELAAGSQGLLSASGILALIVGGTMFLLQKISQKKPSYAKNTGMQNKAANAQNTEQTMKMVSYFMVIMMATFAYSNNALALYWVVGNIYSIGQTLVNRKLNERKHEQLKQKELLG